MSQSPPNRDAKPAETPPKAGVPQTKHAALRDRKITVTLSLPKAVFSVLFSVFALIWVFIFGVMLGRGHNPEEVVPELARVMPAPAASASVPRNIPANEAINDILGPQDLQYHDSLKTMDLVENPQPTVPAKPQTPRQTPPPATPKPVTPISPAPATPAESRGGTVYNYTYQVAAFTNVTAAQSMQKRLQGGGLSVRIAQTASGGTVWHRLLVSFTGTPEETRELREKLAPYGISSIILRGKTPAR